MTDRLPATTAPKGSKRSSPGLAASNDERIEHRQWIGGAVRELLLEAKVLKAHELTREMPPAMPWGEGAAPVVAECGPKPDWRSLK